MLKTLHMASHSRHKVCLLAVDNLLHPFAMKMRHNQHVSCCERITAVPMYSTGMGIEVADAQP